MHHTFWEDKSRKIITSHSFTIEQGKNESLGWPTPEQLNHNS